MRGVHCWPTFVFRETENDTAARYPLVAERFPLNRVGTHRG